MKSKFLISKIPIGKLNAMVKNIMTQTGIIDPVEAVRMMNSGELLVSVKPKWTEEDGIIYLSVTSDDKTGGEWINHFDKTGRRSSDYAKILVDSKKFKPTNGIIYKIAFLKGNLFSDDERTTENIQKMAKDKNFTVPNPEIACLIREKISNKELEAMGLYYIVIMHEPIEDYDCVPRLLCVGINEVLSTAPNHPGDSWNPGYYFAFVVSQESV